MPRTPALLAVLALCLPASALNLDAGFSAAAGQAQAARQLAAAPKTPSCLPLVSELRAAAPYGGVYDHAIWSAACPMAKPPAGMSGRVFLYEYRLTNLSLTEIGLSLGGEFLYSPFFEIVAGLTVALPPGKTLLVSFASAAPPHVETAKRDILYVHEGRRMVANDGAAALFAPSRRRPYVVLKNALVSSR